MQWSRNLKEDVQAIKLPPFDCSKKSRSTLKSGLKVSTREVTAVIHENMNTTENALDTAFAKRGQTQTYGHLLAQHLAPSASICTEESHQYNSIRLAIGALEGWRLTPVNDFPSNSGSLQVNNADISRQERGPRVSRCSRICLFYFIRVGNASEWSPFTLLCPEPLLQAPVGLCSALSRMLFATTSIEEDTDEQQIAAEALKICLEEEDSLADQVDLLISQCVEDFPDNDTVDDAARYAAEIARASISDKTRGGHIRIIKAYIAYHRRRTPSWDPKTVSMTTPNDICTFIISKCGQKDKGGEGKKFSTAVSTRAALTFWYRNVRPHESVVEWRFDAATQTCHGLPTRSRQVSEFMTGLEKTKARAGEVSQSARALTLQDMHRIYDHCFRETASHAERRWGIVRYTAYLLAWLLLLRIEEVVRLEFESIDIIPGEREMFEVRLSTRKTAQTGVTHTWTLHANDEDPKICPVRGIIRLAALYGDAVELTGPLFLKVGKHGAVLQEPVTNSILSRALTLDLQDLGYKSWALFGTHSFRRGGCQHRIKNKGWSVDMVAGWGGWSQVEAITMFRYFYSPNDNHEYMADYDRNLPKRQCININRF